MTKYDGFIGKILDNKYRILDVVGSGGMAVVLKAEDINMKRLVAIKILNDEYNGNETAEKRFANEAKAVAMLSQENIVSIYDIAMYPDMKYIVMEFLDGISLREYLDNKGALSWKEACVYVLQILRALEHAHSKGIIHRDIKPQNVMLLKSGEIKVTDFGIAKTPTTDTMTTTQKAIGTVYYISPEQACGRATGYASDLYSLGIMLFEAVTGTLPFTGDNSVQIAMQQVNNDPPDPKTLVPSLPVGVKQIILKAMQKDPLNRFSSAHSMAKAIEWLLRHPDATFVDNKGAPETAPVAGGNTAVAVSIDMIDTSQIERIGNTEIVESIYGRKPKKEKPKAEKKTKKTKTNKKKRKQSHSMFPIISGVTIAAVIVAVALGVLAAIKVLSGIFRTEDSVTATYPDIVGMVWNNQLEAQLLNGEYGGACFKVKASNITFVENDNFNPGEVVFTEPAAFTVKKKSKSDADKYFYFDQIMICGTGGEMLLPDITYMKSNAAKMMLQNQYGLKIEKTEYIDDNDFFEDQVIRTEPPAGTIVTVGSKVTVYVCSHKTVYHSTLPMPELVGKKESVARQAAENALFNVRVEYVSTTEYEEGTVISQSIKKGEIKDAGTQVVLTVAQPQTGLPVENFVGRTYSEILEMFASSKFNFNSGASRYFYVDQSEFGQLQSSLQFFEQFREAYEVMSSKYQLTFAADNAVVLYQDVKAYSYAEEGTSITLIFGVDPNIVPDESGDTSSDDDPSGDTSSDDTSSDDGPSEDENPVVGPAED